jgi:hypothetical protein
MNEWTISKSLYMYDRPGSAPGNQIISIIDGPNTDKTLVIEKSAYDELKKEYDEECGVVRDNFDLYEKTYAKLKIAVEALQLSHACDETGVSENCPACIAIDKINETAN